MPSFVIQYILGVREESVKPINGVTDFQLARVSISFQQASNSRENPLLKLITTN
jgi:hypothetical protein